MTYSNILLYGAEAAPRPPLSIKERVRFAARRKVHGFLDATRCRQGDLSGLDYRNYEGRDAINQGDVAITQATQALIRQSLPAARQAIGQSAMTFAQKELSESVMNQKLTQFYENIASKLNR
jgi:hypothetical protein